MALRHSLFPLIHCLCASVTVAEQLQPATLIALQNHPKVLAEVAKHLQASAEVKRERAILYPRLEFTTDGGKELFGNAPKSQARSMGEDPYIDGILSANQRLYDFGATTARIRSAKLSEAAQSLGPDIALNTLLSDTAKLVREAKFRRRSSELGRLILEQLEPEQAKAELRFQQGLESASEARRLSLRKEAIERQILLDSTRLKGIETSALEQFAIPLSQLEALHKHLELIANISDGPTLLIEQLHRQKQAQVNQTLAIEAESLPVLSLEVEGRLFDMDEGIGDYEVTGSLKLAIPFFDGGAREARKQAAQAKVQATDAEIQFERRALGERLSQLASESEQLIGQLHSLDEQSKKLIELLQGGILKQGKTGTSQGEVANTILAIYENDLDKLNVEVEQLRIGDEKIGLLQSWPSFFTALKDDLNDES